MVSVTVGVSSRKLVISAGHQARDVLQSWSLLSLALWLLVS